jgi:hypothetical protein
MGSRTFLVSVLYGVASGLAVHHVPRVVVDGTVLLLFLTSASFFHWLLLLVVVVVVVVVPCCCSLSVRNTTATHNIHTYVQCGLDLFSVRFHWSISSSWLAPQGIVTLYRYVVQSDWIRLVFLYTKLIVGGKHSKYQMDYAIYLADCTCRSAHSLESIFFNSIQ